MSFPNMNSLQHKKANIALMSYTIRLSYLRYKNYVIVNTLRKLLSIILQEEKLNVHNARVHSNLDFLCVCKNQDKYAKNLVIILVIFHFH